MTVPVPWQSPACMACLACTYDLDVVIDLEVDLAYRASRQPHRDVPIK